MNVKQRRFSAEYLVDLNATQAAIRAGYSAKTAYSQGQRLLNHVEVAAEIARAQQERADRTGITQDRVLEELKILLSSDVRHFHVSDDGTLTLAEGVPEAAWRAVSSVKHRIIREGDRVIREVQFRLWDKPATARLVAQHLGMLTEQVRVEMLEKLTDEELAQVARGKMKIA